MPQLKLNTQYFILTGAMGAGKSTVLKELVKLGLKVVGEPARDIIAEQREIDGEGIYDRDPKLFYNLMLSRSIFQYKHYLNAKNPILWDRGIADNIEYAKLFNVNPKAAEKASKIYRYNPIVFFFPAWEAIYTNDEERKMPFVESKIFGEKLKETYLELGYQIVDVPLVLPEDRAKFIAENLSSTKLIR